MSGGQCRRVGVVVLAFVGLPQFVSCSAGDDDAPTATLTSPSPAVPSDSAATSMDVVESAVREKVTEAEGSLPGVIVLVRVGDQTHIVTAGMADTKTRTVMRASDTFPIASITKPMVATAVLQQVEAGTLRLDDTVEQWLPGVVTQGDQMTIRQLLSHRSGIHEPVDDEELPRSATLPDRKILRLVGARRPDFKPGTDGSYSNLGYVALGMILEKAAKAPLGEVLATQIWRPAGMDHTSLAPKRWDVAGYEHDRDVTADSWLNQTQAAGGVVATAEDVESFFEHLWAGDLLDPATLDQMTTPSGTHPFGSGDYGLGLWMVYLKCGMALGHSGAKPGYAIKAWTLPEADRSTVVMVNDGQMHPIADGIAEAALCAT